MSLRVTFVVVCGATNTGELSNPSFFYKINEIIPIKKINDGYFHPLPMSLRATFVVVYGATNTGELSNPSFFIKSTKSYQSKKSTMAISTRCLCPYGQH